MDSRELRSIQEAYMEVVENQQQLDEGYKIYSNRKVQDKMDKLKSKGDLESVGRAGQIRDKLIKRSFSSQIPDKEEKLNRNKSEKYKRSKTVSDNTEKKKSFPNRLTRSDKQGIRDSYDYYDIILSHLLDEGYADTNKAALAIMANMSEEWKQSIVEEVLDEAEGSYGQTPKARKSYGDLATKRRATPASGFSKRGEKTTKVKSAEKHFHRTGNPDAGNRGKKSTKPSFHSGARKGMTQKDRDYSRGEAEYGHTGYDPDFDGGPSAPGSKPKGKKAERQKKTGVSAESFDIYDIILSHLLDEGYAETPEAAESIMVNMSEEWRDSIIG